MPEPTISPEEQPVDGTIEVEVNWTLTERRSGRLTIRDGDHDQITEQVNGQLNADVHQGSLEEERQIAFSWTEPRTRRFGGRTY
jgi:hypothetical protein